MAATKKTIRSKTGSAARAATYRSSGTRRPGRGNTGQDEPNAAPSQWGRRLARLAGARFGVEMVDNHARNEGTIGERNIVIKCAKSLMPPVSVLTEMMERLDQLWAVYLMPAGHAEVWAVDIEKVRERGYFTRGLKTQKRVEIYLKTIREIGEKVGELTEAEVESCHIP
jgi:hypothetical protein